MRQSTTIRLDQTVLDEAKRRARDENRTLTNYIETLLRRDLRLGQPAIEVIAPADIRDYEPVPLKGERPEQRERRKKMIAAILDQAGD